MAQCDNYRRNLQHDAAIAHIPVLFSFPLRNKIVNRPITLSTNNYVYTRYEHK